MRTSSSLLMILKPSSVTTTLEYRLKHILLEFTHVRVLLLLYDDEDVEEAYCAYPPFITTFIFLILQWACCPVAAFGGYISQTCCSCCCPDKDNPEQNPWITWSSDSSVATPTWWMRIRKYFMALTSPVLKLHQQAPQLLSSRVLS